MKTRRGISEIVGAFIIITVVTISAILYVNVALKQARIIDTQLNQKAEQIAEQVSPLGITPIVASGKLMITLAPTKPGEKLHIIVLDIENNKIYNKTIIANDTQTMVPILDTYNCSKIKIIVIRESGAIIQYNSYNDPRATTHHNDPTVFSCEILGDDTSTAMMKEPLYNKTITRVFDIRTTDEIEAVPLNYGIVVTLGGSAFINPEPTCVLRLSINNSFVEEIKECNYTKKIDSFNINGNNVDVFLKIRANNDIIVGYIDFKVNDSTNLYVFHLNTTYKLGIYYVYVFRYSQEIGTLADTIHPVPLAQAVNGSYNATWNVFRESRYAVYFLTALGEGQSDVITTGPMVLFMSTKKERATFTIKHGIYIERIYYAPLRYQDYNLGMITQITVNTTSLIETTAGDPLTRAVLLIDKDDWNQGSPRLIVEDNHTYSLHEDSIYKIVCPQGCYANLRFYGSSARIPFATDINYNESIIIRSTGHTVYINISLGAGQPKPLVNTPLSVDLEYDGRREIILVSLDDAGPINGTVGPLQWTTPITAYTLAGTQIPAEIMGAEQVCLLELTHEARLPARAQYSLVEPPPAACGPLVSTSPQTLYTITLYSRAPSADDLEAIIYANYMYRLLYSS